MWPRIQVNFPIQVCEACKELLKSYKSFSHAVYLPVVLCTSPYSAATPEMLHHVHHTKQNTLFISQNKINSAQGVFICSLFVLLLLCLLLFATVIIYTDYLILLCLLLSYSIRKRGGILLSYGSYSIITYPNNSFQICNHLISCAHQSCFS